MSLNNKKKDIVLFTGQSGIDIKNCLNQLEELTSLTPFFVEEQMQEFSKKNFLQILSLPPKIQEELWKNAFSSKIKNNLPPNSGKGKNLFIAFHATYYHQRNTEFLSPVDFGELLDLKDRTKMIIVFIDDCYDIYKRLMDEKQMFAYIRKLEPEDALIQSISNIFTILEWREIEIAFSRKIAQLLGIPMFILAVKHPCSVLSRLIDNYENLMVFYLSHPISSIREAPHPRLSEFYTELNQFIRDVIAKENIIFFIPDAIDEKRIKSNDNGIFIPEISEGWPLPFQDNWLFSSLPSRVKDINPLNPLNFNFHNAPEGKQSTISKLIGILLNKINQQINSRDRTLVEQSKDGVLVYRPYWEAKTPGGVEQELIHNDDLRKNYDENKRKVFIINTNEDFAKLRIKILFIFIENNINMNEKHKKVVNNFCKDWIEDQTKIRIFLKIEDVFKEKENLIKSIEEILPADYEFAEEIQKSTLGIGRMLAEVERQKKFWDKIFNQIPEYDPFLKYTSQTEDLYLSFSNNELNLALKDFIKNNFKK